MDNIETEIYLRPAKEEDLNFIVSAFVRERQNWIQYKYINKDLHIKFSEKVLANLFSRGANAYIAVLNKNPDVYVGYVITEKLGTTEDDPCVIVHFLYVKKSLRKKGVTKAILSHLKVDTNKPILTSCACPIFNAPNIRQKYKFVVRPDLSGSIFY